MGIPDEKARERSATWSLCSKFPNKLYSLYLFVNKLVDFEWKAWSGNRDGTVVRALASHQILWPRFDSILGVTGRLSLLVLSSAPRGFSPGTRKQLKNCIKVLASRTAWDVTNQCLELWHQDCYCFTCSISFLSVFLSFFCRILQVQCEKLRLEDSFDFVSLARLTPGFVGADLMSLTREAALIAVNRWKIQFPLNIKPSSC